MGGRLRIVTNFGAGETISDWKWQKVTHKAYSQYSGNRDVTFYKLRIRKRRTRSRLLVLCSFYWIVLDEDKNSRPLDQVRGIRKRSQASRESLLTAIVETTKTKWVLQSTHLIIHHKISHTISASKTIQFFPINKA